MNIKNINDEIVLFCAFRYALGRRTYVVDSVVQTILENWDNIPEPHKEKMKKEIKEHKETWGNLGDGCDEERWNMILAK